MRKLELEICTGIGDNLVIRIFFDTVKHNYDQIRIAHNKAVIREFWDNRPEYQYFCNNIGQALFSEHPYVYDHGNYPTIQTHNIITSLRIVPVKPKLDHILCQGIPLDLDEEYVVITTKIRYMSKATFYPLSIKLWSILREVAKRYKIVVLGERILEDSKEVRVNNGVMFCIYEQIVANIPADRLVDLTFPAFGITVPNFNRIQQDCLIQKQAKFVITLGVGGNFCMAAATANKVIGFRTDNDGVADLMSNPAYPSLSITKDWGTFINLLREQIK